MWQRPKFWQKKFSLGLLLLPLAFLYGLIARARFKQKPARAAIKVICVGNFIVGGAGKTPTSLYIAAALKARGKNPFILTRGYGGKVKEPRRVDGARDSAAQVGDEALMMARYFPTIVGADRLKAARKAEQEGADILVLDDGFQNPQPHKDLSVLVIDSYGLGNGFLLPAGPVREAPKRALRRAQGIIVIADKPPVLPPHDLPLIYAEIIPRGRAGALVDLPKNVIAFAGLGAPEKFWRTLEELGIRVLEHYAYGDHYVYKEKDAAFLLKRAQTLDAALITTEKDAVRLDAVRPDTAHSSAAQQTALALLKEKTYTLPITLEIKQEEGLQSLLDRVIK